MYIIIKFPNIFIKIERGEYMHDLGILLGGP